MSRGDLRGLSARMIEHRWVRLPLPISGLGIAELEGRGVRIVDRGELPLDVAQTLVARGWRPEVRRRGEVDCWHPPREEGPAPLWEQQYMGRLAPSPTRCTCSLMQKRSRHPRTWCPFCQEEHAACA